MNSLSQVTETVYRSRTNFPLYERLEHRAARVYFWSTAPSFVMDWSTDQWYDRWNLLRDRTWNDALTSCHMNSAHQLWNTEFKWNRKEIVAARLVQGWPQKLPSSFMPVPLNMCGTLNKRSLEMLSPEIQRWALFMLDGGAWAHPGSNIGISRWDCKSQIICIANNTDRSQFTDLSSTASCRTVAIEKYL